MKGVAVHTTLPGLVDLDVRQILRNDPAAFRIRLHKNEIDPDIAFTPDSLTPADFNGIPWAEVADPCWLFPIAEPNGTDEIVSDRVSWELPEDGTPGDVAGWSLWYVTPEAVQLVGVEQFERPITLAAPGDKLERVFRFVVNDFSVV